MRVRRDFALDNAALLRRGRVVALLTAVRGKTDGGVPDMSGQLVGRRSMWVTPGAALTFAWPSSNQPRSAWLEADATVAAVDGDRVTVAGTSSCRPSRDPRLPVGPA